MLYRHNGALFFANGTALFSNGAVVLKYRKAEKAIKFVFSLHLKPKPKSIINDEQAKRTRLYSMADANLKQLADDLKNTIERDAADFATRNIGASQLTAFEGLITAFDATTTDVELKGMVSATVALKDATVENVKMAIRTVRSMAEQAYGTKGLYKTFGFEEMGNLSDNDLYRMARRVIRTATKRQADLAIQGFVPAQLTGLTTLATQLDDQLDDIHDAETDRDLETQGRVQKGNGLYKEVMRLARIGKSLFADTDEARYNDYILLEKRSGNDDNDTPPDTAK